MDLSLLTLLRREDIVSIGIIDVHDGALWIVPGKTEGSTRARLRIELDGNLPAVVARYRDGVLSPYFIHRLPEKERSRDLRAKTREHHTQVLPEQLSRAFAKRALPRVSMGKIRQHFTRFAFSAVRCYARAAGPLSRCRH